MKHHLRITFMLVLLFFSAQIIGLFVTQQYITTTPTGEVEWKELPSVFGVEVERPDIAPQQSIWYILTVLIFGTFLILMIIRFAGIKLWKVWFFLAVALCLEIAFAAWLPVTAALMVAFLAAWVKIYKPNIYVHNATELFLYGGLAVIFVPILNVFYTILLLLALSVYDMYAVWKSKHMIKLAKFQTKSGVFAGLLIPYKLPKLGKRTRTVKVQTAVLGGGDIGFPLIFAGTVLKTSGMMNALLIAIGASLALFLLLMLGKKDRFYPAMPYLTVGCLLGYALTLL